MVGKAWSPLAIVLTVLCLAPAVTSQVPQDGTLQVTFLGPDSAVKDGTTRIRDGVGNATLRVGFTPPTRSSSCIGGAFLDVSVTAQATPNDVGHWNLEPKRVPIPADHVPTAATPATRWSGPMGFEVGLGGYEQPAGTTIEYEFRVLAPQVSGGQCSPLAFSNLALVPARLKAVVETAGNESTNQSSPAADAPGVGSVVVFATVLLAFVAVRRRD